MDGDLSVSGDVSVSGGVTVAGSLTAGTLLLKKGTYTAAATTPSVSGLNWLEITNSVATVITNFTNGTAGQLLTLEFTGATPNSTIASGATVKLAGGVNFVSTQYDTLTLLYTGSLWVEVARSVNA